MISKVRFIISLNWTLVGSNRKKGDSLTMLVKLGVHGVIRGLRCGVNWGSSKTYEQFKSYLEQAPATVSSNKRVHPGRKCYTLLVTPLQLDYLEGRNILSCLVA